MNLRGTGAKDATPQVNYAITAIHYTLVSDIFNPLFTHFLHIEEVPRLRLDGEWFQFMSRYTTEIGAKWGEIR